MATIEHKRYIIHPGKFGLWVFMVTVVLFFGGLTSAYIVEKGILLDKGAWQVIPIPSILYVTSSIALASSGVLWWGMKGARAGDARRFKSGLVISGLLMLAFIVGQVAGWQRIQEMGFELRNNPAGGFVMILIYAHALHLLSAVLFLAYVLVKVFRNRVDLASSVMLESFATYWHFLGLLWIYLFLFLLINHN